MERRSRTLWIVQIVAFVLYSLAMPAGAYAQLSGGLGAHQPMQSHHMSGHEAHEADLTHGQGDLVGSAYQHSDKPAGADKLCCSLIGGMCVVLLIMPPGPPEIGRAAAMEGHPLPDWSDAPRTSLPHPPKRHIS